MAEPISKDPAVFRADLRLYIVVVVFATLLFGISGAVGVSKGDWTFFAVVATVFAILFLVVNYLRMEIGPDGFVYRTPMTNRSIDFGEVECGQFVTHLVNGAPTGASFSLVLREGKAMNVSLRAFPIRAAAMLFAQLDRRGIPINVPDTMVAQRMAGQIREEQAKLGR